MVKLTTSGKDLLLRTLAGQTGIRFIKIQLGNGADAGVNAMGLSNPLLSVDITKCEVTGAYATVTSVFNNNTVSSGFRATELGVLVEDPDSVTGGTLLYAYEYTPEEMSDYIPCAEDRVLETQIDVMSYIGDAENVSASISQSMVYASKKELYDHVNGHDNPHGVTAEQVGALPRTGGKIDGELILLGSESSLNVRVKMIGHMFKDAKLRGDYAYDVKTPTPDSDTGAVSMSDPIFHFESPAQFSRGLSAAGQAVRSVASPEYGSDAANKYYVDNKVKEAAAPKSHRHDTTDITSGTLGVPRGGTGAAALTKGGLILGNGIDPVTELTGTGAVYATESGSPAFGTLPVICGGTGVKDLVGTDYSQYRVRGISIQSSTPSSISNGQIVLVYL